MLVTLDNMKSYLGIGDTSQDAFLTDQLSVISDAIETYCHRKFNQATYTQTFYSDDYNKIMKELTLLVFPLVSVSSVVIDGTTLDPSLYRVCKPAGVLVRPDFGWFIRTELQTVVTYSAGYADADIPIALQSVVKSIVQERYNRKTAGVDLNFGSDVQSVSIPGTISVAFDYTLTNNDRTVPMGQILGNYLNVIDLYRSERAIVGSGVLSYVS